MNKFRVQRDADGSWHYFTVEDLHAGDSSWLIAAIGTWSQFTGLKDKNGVEIYKGDIVKCNDGHVGIIEWEDHDCCFNVRGYYNPSNDYPTMAFMEGQPFEVIGNIHENPELLTN